MSMLTCSRCKIVVFGRGTNMLCAQIATRRQLHYSPERGCLDIRCACEGMESGYWSGHRIYCVVGKDR